MHEKNRSQFSVRFGIGLGQRCQDAELLIRIRRSQRIRGRPDRSRVCLRVHSNGPRVLRFGIVHRALLEVGPHVAALGEAQSAVGAGVGLGARVVVEVGLEVVLLGERLGAKGALVRLQAGVQPGVQRHVGPVREGLLADLALVGPLAGVRPEVLLQQHLPREGLPALLALVRLNARVYPDVHVVGHPLVEALPAFRATVLLPVAVDLHVGAEVAAVVEVLAAFRARGGELPGALVHAPMVLVIAQLRELLAAVGATERLLPGVGSDVYLNRIGTEMRGLRPAGLFCTSVAHLFLADLANPPGDCE